MASRSGALLGLALLVCIISEAAATFYPFPCPPVICGPGTKKPVCPVVACSSSWALAASGPGGCAIANSQVSSYAMGVSYFAPLVSVYAEQMKKFCYQPTGAVLKAAAEAAAVATSTAVAEASTRYFQYACTCDGKPGFAAAKVKTAVQSVAKAVAFAYAQAVASVGQNCDKYDWLAYAYADATAISESVETALLKIYSKIAAKNGACVGKYEEKFKYAVAQASACAWASVFTKAYNIGDVDGAEAASCSASLSLSGSFAGGPFVCDTSCHCPPGSVGVPPTQCIPKPNYGACPKGTAPFTSCNPGCLEDPYFDGAVGDGNDVCYPAAGGNGQTVCGFNIYCDAATLCSKDSDCFSKLDYSWRCINTPGTCNLRMCIKVATPETCAAPTLSTFLAKAQITPPRKSGKKSSRK